MIVHVRSFDEPAAADAAFVLARNVHFLLIADGTGRLLDLDGSFFTLSTTATRMLLGVLDGSADDTARSIAQVFSAHPDVVRADLDAFIASIAQRGLIEPADTRAHNPARPPRLGNRLLIAALGATGWRQWPVRSRATLLLALGFLSIRLCGWSETIRIWHDQFGAGSEVASQTRAAERAEAIDWAVREAAAGHPLNITCKERALCCWALGRAEGLPVRLVFGVDLLPLASHCWCELGTTILTDYEDRCQRFVPILAYG